MVLTYDLWPQRYHGGNKLLSIFFLVSSCIFNIKYWDELFIPLVPVCISTYGSDRMPRQWNMTNSYLLKCCFSEPKADLRQQQMNAFGNPNPQLSDKDCLRSLFYLHFARVVAVSAIKPLLITTVFLLFLCFLRVLSEPNRFHPSACLWAFCPACKNIRSEMDLDDQMSSGKWINKITEM